MNPNPTAKNIPVAQVDNSAIQEFYTNPIDIAVLEISKKINKHFPARIWFDSWYTEKSQQDSSLINNRIISI